MNSSVSFLESEKAAKVRSIDHVNWREANSRTVPDANYLYRRATRLGISREGGMTAVVQRRFFSADESPGDQGLPPFPNTAVCRSYDERVILFLDAEDTPRRENELKARMIRLGAEVGRELLFRCKRGELDKQLGYAKSWATELGVRRPMRPFFVGINGIDLWLKSPTDAAFRLQAIHNIGATVVCAVDARYGDSRLLMFHLRTRGITVIREPVVPQRLTRLSSAREIQCGSPGAENVPPARPFPSVQTTALAAYAAALQNPSAKMAWNNRARQSGVKRRRIRDGTAHSDFPEYERVKHARAFRSGFAVNRLLREQKAR